MRGPQSTTATISAAREVFPADPHAALIGALVGGLVPWFGRTLAHDQVLGCALFSALSVYKFGRAAFGDSRKALGFVLALEGVMLVSIGATSTVALAVLILINAVANGSVIALARDATRRRCEADARRAATRARSRTAARGTEQIDVSTSRHASVVAETDRRTATRPARAADAADVAMVAPVWRRATLDDVIDAEIVSEEKFLS